MNKANNAVELPSLEEIQEMNRQQQKAMVSLEVSDNGKLVKCQKCGRLVSMFTKILKPHSVSNRIVTLQKRIKWAEKNSNNTNDVNSLKQVLSDLLKEEEKNDLLRRLPLHNSRMTGYKWICSECWDQAYWLLNRPGQNQKRERKRWWSQ
jgi:hypothetical protein